MESTNEENRNFLASYQQCKDFIASVLWADLQAEIRCWIDDIHGYLESETDIQEIYRFQGRLQSCKQLLNLPDRILAIMEAAHIAHDTELDSADSTAYSYYEEQLQKWSEEDLDNA